VVTPCQQLRCRSGNNLRGNIERGRAIYVSWDRQVLDLLPEPAETDKAFRRGNVLGEPSIRVGIAEGRREE
jgi:hypothetical protein